MPDKNSKSAQHIWPIFVIAVLLGIFGFAMALKSTPKPLPTRSVERLKFEMPEFKKGIMNSQEVAKTDTSKPVEIAHKNLSRKYKVFIEQDSVMSSHNNSSFFSFTLVEEKKSDNMFHRTFENAAIEIYSDKKVIDASISFDVARLIQTTKYEVTVDEKGNQKVKLISSDPGKLRSVLRLIESSLTLLHTTLPKDALPIGEKWKYVLPKQDVEFGAVRVLLGQTENTVIVRQTVNQLNVLKTIKTHVTGSGTSVIYKADGGLKEATLTLQTIVGLKDRKHISSTTIVLKAVQ